MINKPELIRVVDEISKLPEENSIESRIIGDNLFSLVVNPDEFSDKTFIFYTNIKTTIQKSFMLYKDRLYEITMKLYFQIVQYISLKTEYEARLETMASNIDVDAATNIYEVLLNLKKQLDMVIDSKITDHKSLK